MSYLHVILHEYFYQYIGVDINKNNNILQMEPQSIDQKDESQKQTENQSNIGTTQLEEMEDSDSSDDVFQEQSEQDQIERPKNQQITEDQCYEDDEIKDSDDSLVEQEQSVIADSDEQQQKYMEAQQKKEEKQGTKPKSKLILRDYQNLLFNRSLGKNRIIYLPTGKGKTLVSIASMYYYLCKQGEQKKIIFLANTIQLVKQQSDAIKRNLQKIIEDPNLSTSLRKQVNSGSVKWTAEQIKNKVCCIHGEKTDQVGMTRRKKIEAELTSKKQILETFKKSTIIVMIAQMFLNCLRRGYVKLTDFSFMVFDQCHHCHGNHPYAGIMRQFYFAKPKIDKKLERQLQRREIQLKLPVIMGLTASPVTLQTFDKEKLVKQIRQLCGNLNSRFTSYQTEKIKNETVIQVIKAVQSQDRQQVPDLIAHFQRFRDHREAYDKIRKHFPSYFECIRKVIDFLKSKYQKQLDLQADPYTIFDVQLLLFYDIKQCLLIKLRDVWLQLGLYAFSIAFEELYIQLGKISLKNDQNKLILNQVMNIIKQYIIKFKKECGECRQQFFSAKVKELIKLLSQKTNQVKLQSTNLTQMVVVFAAKRRTVKYLEKIIKNYKQTLPESQQPSYQCDKVTGYSIRTISDYSKNQIIFDADPSSFRFYAEAEHRYNAYLNDLQQEKQNKMVKVQRQQAESSNLANQIRRMRSVKYGKLLLEVQEKYSTQIETIKRFRAKKFRVLITTSVTQQGFDIPECKIVISFDRPSSLKSYIQIKGRARQQYSKYFIFTTQRNYKAMLSNKQFYDDIINATFQIAINKFSDKDGINQQITGLPAIIKSEEGYKSTTVRQTGAVINTSYALEILKTYCASLRSPNKPKFYFIQTPNVAFRCLVYFPKTAPTSKPYITGQSKSSKHQALKSAAFQAVKYLYLEKYIKADLRPKKYQQLQDQRQIQRFQDLEQTRRNESYKKIFEQQVRIKCEMVKDRKFMRFYFKTFASPDLDFHYLNPLFKNHIKKFQKQRFPFQIYMMNFNNPRNLRELKKDENVQQIGVLTCFQSKYNEEVFSQYEYSFQQNDSQKFTLKLQKEHLELNKEEYDRLKRIHQFIVTASLGREVHHYSKLTGKKPIPNKWVSQKSKSDLMTADQNREFYPILVILIKKNGKYELDQQSNKNIQEHENIFKEIYEYHNQVGKQNSYQKFGINLTPQYEKLVSQIRTNKFDESLIVQSIEKQHCFSKCIISGKQTYTQSMQKNKDKRKSLTSRNKKMKLMFHHAQQQIKEVVKIVFWVKYKKQKKKQIFERDGKLTIKEVENPRYYLISQYVIYPISTNLLFKATLAVQYLFKAVFQYSLALYFRNYKLPQIFKTKIKENNVNEDKPFCFVSYPSIILENGPSIFKYLAENSSSQYLRNIGKSYEHGSKFSKPKYQFSLSKMNLSIDESSIVYNKNQTVNNSMEMSELGLSKILDHSTNQNNSFDNENNKSIAEYTQQKSMNLVTQIKINEMLKVLTSRMYKFNKLDNYEEYQFIGDVVLKMLSTIQIFLQKPISDESELHISRANVICNANLHRKAILKHIYRFILSKKCDQLPPPYAYTPLNDIQQEMYEKTTFKKYNQNTQINGFHYIPGKVHADIVEALIGAFYLHSRQLNDCQLLLYALDILKKPLLKINFDNSRMPMNTRPLPKLFSDFEDRFQYHFKNKGLLIQALTHSSFKTILNTVIDKNSIQQILQENANKSFASQASFLSTSFQQINKNVTTKTVPWETFYERLQFLGDSILDLIVVEYLHDKYETKDQGTLTALKQAGVSNKTLGMIAINYGMHELILMDYPENDKVMKEFQKITENFNTYLNDPEALMDAKVNSIKILGDVFQALVGAIFVDLELDYNATKSVVMKKMKDFLVHYTDLQNLKKSSSYKYQEFLNKNNYRDCQLRKDTTQQIENGNFKYLLIDRSGAIVEECWETTQKRAWDIILEKFYKKNMQNGITI